jgi:glycosyltransferase involved in cell wall biosynthesis
MFQYCQAVLEAIASLPKTKFSVVVAYTSLQWEPYLNSYELDTFHIKNPERWWSLSHLWYVTGLPVGLWRSIAAYLDPDVKTFAKRKCDLWIFPSQDIWSYMAQVPSLTSIHDLMHRYERGFPEVSAHGRYYFRERRFRNICQWAKGILVDSNVGKQQVYESYQAPAEKIYVLPYVPPKYISETLVQSDLVENYHLPEKFIFYPAQFWLHKNHARLITALAKVKKKHPDILLVLVGSKKNAHEDVEDRIKSLGLSYQVRILGYVPNNHMPEFYRRARAMVMPTFFGPTNIPPLEAFALGCPVAVSNIYGIPEQVGDAALLFDPNSVDEIADCIERLWQDDALCASLISKGYARSVLWGQQKFSHVLHGIVEKLTN